MSKYPNHSAIRFQHAIGHGGVFMKGEEIVDVLDAEQPGLHHGSESVMLNGYSQTLPKSTGYVVKNPIIVYGIPNDTWKRDMQALVETAMQRSVKLEKENEDLKKLLKAQEERADANYDAFLKKEEASTKHYKDFKEERELKERAIADCRKIQKAIGEMKFNEIVGAM